MGCPNLRYATLLGLPSAYLLVWLSFVLFWYVKIQILMNGYKQFFFKFWTLYSKYKKITTTKCLNIKSEVNKIILLEFKDCLLKKWNLKKKTKIYLPRFSLGNELSWSKRIEEGTHWMSITSSRCPPSANIGDRVVCPKFGHPVPSSKFFIVCHSSYKLCGHWSVHNSASRT